MLLLGYSYSTTSATVAATTADTCDTVTRTRTATIPATNTKIFTITDIYSYSYCSYY